MTSTAAAAHVRQLCALGIEPGQLIHPLLKALHEVVPSALNLFAWADRHGNPGEFIAEFPTPVHLVEHYVAEFLGRPGAEVGPSFQAIMGRPGHMDSGDEYGREYSESGIVQCIMRPLGLENALRVTVGDRYGSVGVLTMDRERGDGLFTAAERRRLGELLPHLAMALRGPGAPTDRWVDAHEEGMMALDERGALHFASTGAQHLLMLASGPRISGGRPERGRDGLLQDVAGLARRLRAVTSGRPAPPAYHEVINAWGRFEFRAHWLEPSLAGSGGLIGVTLKRWQPLQVRVAEGARRLKLSPRQRQLCQVAVTGASYGEMAARLGIATTTAISYMRVVYDKLGINSREELAARLLGEEHPSIVVTGDRGR